MRNCDSEGKGFSNTIITSQAMFPLKEYEIRKKQNQTSTKNPFKKANWLLACRYIQIHIKCLLFYFYVFSGKQVGKRKLLGSLMWRGTGSAVMGSHYVWQKVMVRSCLTFHVVFVCFYTKLFPCGSVHDIVVCTLCRRFSKFQGNQKILTGFWRSDLYLDTIITNTFV